MSRHGYYGSKCHKCAHLDGPTHDSEIVWPVERDDCPTCSFCQSNAFIGALLRASGAFDIMPADHFAALKAFKEGKPHPLIDQLRASMLEDDFGAHGGTER